MTQKEQRHSKAAEAELISDPVEKSKAEALNGLKQYDFAKQVIIDALEKKYFKLRLSLVLSLQREALAGISGYAGNFRPSSVSIEGSKHEPMGAHLVAEAVEEMCDYVNENWDAATAIHLSSYIMWRLNWIHPFADGNGRTSRMLSYLVLCIKAGYNFPGSKTIPEQIVENRGPYFSALDAADAAYKETSKIDLSEMEKLLSGMLAKQLHSSYEDAGGDTHSK